MSTAAAKKAKRSSSAEAAPQECAAPPDKNATSARPNSEREPATTDDSAGNDWLDDLAEHDEAWARYADHWLDRLELLSGEVEAEAVRLAGRRQQCAATARRLEQREIELQEQRESLAELRIGVEAQQASLQTAIAELRAARETADEWLAERTQTRAELEMLRVQVVDLRQANERLTAALHAEDKSLAGASAAAVDPADEATADRGLSPPTDEQTTDSETADSVQKEFERLRRGLKSRKKRSG
jgi:chromosome segregation ATPase